MRPLLVAAVLLAAPATAEVVKVAPHGFALESTAVIAAQPEKLFAAIGSVAQWWDPAHSYSGKAANMSMDVRAGGCWCETVPPGGSVEHMRVVRVLPGRQIVVRGGLGPLQGEGVDGALTWTLKPEGTGTRVTQSYVVGGFLRAGSEVMAPAVDGVMNGALARLKRYVETGSPDPAK